MRAFDFLQLLQFVSSIPTSLKHRPGQTACNNLLQENSHGREDVPSSILSLVRLLVRWLHLRNFTRAQSYQVWIASAPFVFNISWSWHHLWMCFIDLIAVMRWKDFFLGGGALITRSFELEGGGRRAGGVINLHKSICYCERRVVSIAACCSAWAPPCVTLVTVCDTSEAWPGQLATWLHM